MLLPSVKEAERSNVQSRKKYPVAGFWKYMGSYDADTHKEGLLIESWSYREGKRLKRGQVRTENER